MVQGGDGASSESELRRQAAWMLEQLRDPEVVAQLSADELAKLVAVLRGPYERTLRRESGDGE